MVHLPLSHVRKEQIWSKSEVQIGGNGYLSGGQPRVWQVPILCQDWGTVVSTPNKGLSV